MFKKIAEEAERWISDCPERGIYAKVVVVGEQYEPRNPENGVYIIMGLKEKVVENLSYDRKAMLMSYAEHHSEKADTFLPFDIVKCEDISFATVYQFTAKRNAIELIAHIFQKYGYRMPNYVAGEDFKTLYRLYMEMQDEKEIQEDREFAEETLKFVLKVFDSGLTQDEYEKKYGAFQFFADKKLSEEVRKSAKKEADRIFTYTPTSPNYKSYEEIVRNSGQYVTVNVAQRALPYFEREIAKYPNIPFSVITESKLSIHKGHSELFHMVFFPKDFEHIVMAIIYKYEQDIEDIAKLYTPGMREVYGIQVPYQFFRDFYDIAREHDIWIYLDMEGIYVKSTADFIGITTEGEYAFSIVKTFENQMIENYLKGSHLKPKGVIDKR